MIRTRAAVALLVLLLAVPFVASCRGNTAAVTSPPAGPGETVVYPALSYTAAVEKVAAEGSWVAITAFADTRLITLEASDPHFEALVTQLKEAELTDSVPRFREQDGMTVEATVPYAIAFRLEFALTDGSALTFDYGNGHFWFNAADAIYQTSTGYDLYYMLTDLYVQ